MKIAKFKINNYHGISHLEYAPKNKISVITGKNGSGKSSFISSVNYLLTGADKSPTKEGESASQVSITLDNGTTLSRAKKENKTLLGVDKAIVNEKQFSGVIQTEIGQLPENFSLVSSSDIANNINPVDFGNMLVRFIPQDITFTDILNYCDNVTPQKRDILENVISKYSQITITAIKKMGEYFVEERKRLKRDCAALEKQILLYRNTPCDMKQDEIEEAIKKCEEKKVLLKKYDEEKKVYDNVIKTQADAKLKLEEINAFLKTVETLEYSKEGHDKLKKEIEGYRNALKDTELSVAKFREDIESLKKIIDNLESNICPIHKDIVCSTDKSSVKSELLKIVEHNSENLQKAIKVTYDLQKTISKKEAEDAAMQEKSALFSKKTSYLESKAFTEKLLAELVVPKKPEMVDANALKDEIAFIESKKKEYDSYSNYVMTKAMIENSKLTIKTYDELAKSFSDKGEIMSRIMERYVSIIKDACERTCQKFRNSGNDYKLMFVADRGIQIYVKIRDNEYLTIDKLSTGEKIIVSIIIGDMLNQLTGLNIMTIDNLEALDDDSLEVFKNIITDKNIIDMYDHIFITTVSEDAVNKYFSGVEHDTFTLNRN